MRLIALGLVLALVFVPTVGAVPVPEPQQQDVFLPALQNCLWKGSWKVLVDTPVVRVWHYTCDDPDT